MTPAHDVGVVIPAHRAADTLPAAVSSALEQQVAVVAVAVDPADSATWAVADDLSRRDDRVRVVANPGGSTPRGLNRAIAVLDQPIVARLDAHSTLRAGYVAAALAVLDGTGAAVVGGLQRPVGDGFVRRAVAAAMTSPAGAGGARHRIGGRAGPAETAYLGVFRRAWLDRVGGYDDTLERNQDYDVCTRIRRAGGEVWFTPTMVASYTPRGAWGELAAQYHEFGRWKRHVMVAAPDAIRPRQLAAPAIVVVLLAGAVGSAVGVRRARIVPVAYLGGLAAAAATARVPEGPPLSAPERVGVALALATMHLAWGTGFWRGGRGCGP